MTKRALITGINGQDGSYLAELLLRKGYEVHGMVRRASTFNRERIDHLYQDPHEPGTRMFLHYGDLSDGSRLVTLLAGIAPDEVYNLAAQSHVRVSFDEPEYTGDTTGVGTVRLLESVRLAGIETRFYQASTSELFGSTPPPQNPSTSRACGACSRPTSRATTSSRQAKESPCATSSRPRSTMPASTGTTM